MLDGSAFGIVGGQLSLIRLAASHTVSRRSERGGEAGSDEPKSRLRICVRDRCASFGGPAAERLLRLWTALAISVSADAEDGQGGSRVTNASTNPWS